MTVRIDSTVRLNAYVIIAGAVWRGVQHGMQRARKHVAEPTEEAVVEAIYDAVMCELDCVLDFSEGGCGGCCHDRNH